MIFKHLHISFLWIMFDKVTDSHSRMYHRALGRAALISVGGSLIGVVGIQGSSNTLASYLIEYAV